jgi:membrane associated rhomboid family serine protease
LDQYSPGTQFLRFPPAIKYLLIINGLFYVATKSLFGGVWTPIGEHLVSYLALFPFGSDLFRPWQLITYMFLHADFGHIFFNLFILWMFGQAIENIWGTKRFLVYYLLCGFGAAVLHLLSGIPFTYTIGASGGVYGVLLAFGMMYPNRVIMLLIPPIPIKAKYFVAIIGAIELFSGLTNPNSGVAHFAHLGGLLVGFLLIKFWKIKRPEYYG